MPEKALLSGVKNRYCPVCKVPADKLGNVLEVYPRRQMSESTRAATEARLEFILRGERAAKTILEPLNLVDTRIFCAEWARSDIHAAMLPDKLHELEKGVFGNHLLSGLRSMCQREPGRLREFHRRWSTIPAFSGLKTFKNGVLELSMVTGAEYGEMMKVIAAITAGLFDDKRVALSFYHFASFYILVTADSSNNETLSYAYRELSAFVDNVQVFRDLLPSHLNFPKFHSLQHYIQAIVEIGSVNNTNTSCTEALHPINAKEAYRQSNKKDAVKQMLAHVSRRRALKKKLAWFREERIPVSDIVASLLPPTTTAAEEMSKGKAKGVFLSARAEHRIAIMEAAKRRGLQGLWSAIRVHLWKLGLELEGRNVSRAHRPATAALPRPDSDLFRVYGAVRLVYPSLWDEEELHTDIVRCNENWFKQGRRNDSVLLRISDSPGYKGFAVATCLLLFEIMYKRDRLQLAYVKHFDKIASDLDCPFVKVRKCVAEGEVVPIESFERAAHLVPAWKYGVDSGLGYDEFYVNSHVDRHMYHTFYVD